MRGDAPTSHRVQQCVTTNPFRRDLFVLCSAVDNRCEEFAVDVTGRRIPASQAAVEPFVLCSRHGGGRRCSAASCNRSVGDWGRRLSLATGHDVQTQGFCASCAEQANMKPHRSSASLEACTFLDMLGRERSESIEHIHYDASRSEWVGEEEEGLVAPYRDRPDGVVRNSTGRVTKVYFYHGSHVHGFPPDHPQHGSTLKLTKKPAADAYARTMASMQRFADVGYEVGYIWSFEFVPLLRRSGQSCQLVSSLVHML